MLSERKRAQIASTDIIIALVVFIVAGAIFFSLLAGRATNDAASKLDREGDVLVTELVTASPGETNDVSIASGGTINKKNLDSFLTEMTSDENFYEELKAELGLSGDYCIHFETANGSIIYLHDLVRDDPTLAEKFLNVPLDEVDDPSDVTAFGVGSGRIEINDVPCVNYIS